MNEHANTSQRLRTQIEEAILAGQFQPGEKLDETLLAQAYSVSRTPIREALHQLAIAGLIEIRPRRGAIVATVTPQKLYEMFEVMAELEAIAARLAARRLTETEARALQAAHRACEANRDDIDAYYLANEAFHQAIYAASGNQFLAEQCLALQKRLRPYRRHQLRVRNRLQTSFAEHEAVMAAILAGDSAGASEALRAHVRIQGERFGDLVASLPQLGAA